MAQIVFSMKKIIAVFILIISAVSVVYAGFLPKGFGKCPSSPEVGDVIYYPYQVRTVMPITGYDVTPCNYNDECITITFKDHYPVKLIKGNNIAEDVRCLGKDDDYLIYWFFGDDFAINIAFHDKGIVQILQLDPAWAPIYTDYTLTDMRGTATPIHGFNPYTNNSSGYNNSGSSRSSSRRVCPSCNGSKKGTDKIYYGTDYTGNQANEYCPTCNKWTSPHSHHTPSCSVCYGRGYVE